MSVRNAFTKAARAVTDFYVTLRDTQEVESGTYLDIGAGIVTLGVSGVMCLPIIMTRDNPGACMTWVAIAAEPALFSAWVFNDVRQAMRRTRRRIKVLPPEMK